MKHKFYIFIMITILFNACNDESKLIRDNSTVINQKKISIDIDNSQIKKSIIKKIPPREYSFNFENIQKQTSTIKMKNDIYSFTNIKQPIVMITLFSTWCPVCRGQIPHLSSLQKKFKEHLFIMGALVYDEMKDEKLKKIIIAEKMLFFISKNQKDNLRFANMIIPRLRLKEDFPMPLMILFFKGKYFTHYEGRMPEEMIESDIEQLLIKIKKGQ